MLERLCGRKLFHVTHRCWTVHFNPSRRGLALLGNDLTCFWNETINVWPIFKHSHLNEDPVGLRLPQAGRQDENTEVKHEWFVLFIDFLHNSKNTEQHQVLSLRLNCYSRVQKTYREINIFLFFQPLFIFAWSVIYSFNISSQLFWEFKHQQENTTNAAE